MTITLSAIVIWLLIGLVVGGLAHLLVPGRNRVGIILTILVGIVGAIVGGLITAAILGAGHAIITFIVSLIVAALLISAISHPQVPRLPQRRPSPPSPPHLSGACSLARRWSLSVHSRPAFSRGHHG